MNFEIPDAVGEVVEAWRTWFIVDNEGQPMLRSYVYSRFWEPKKPFEGYCQAWHTWPSMLGEEADHRTPGDDCSCGIYALYEREKVKKDYFGREYTPGMMREIYRVIGKVALWGKIVIGEDGVRAEYAYPILIQVPLRVERKRKGETLSLDEILFVLAAYGCEVEMTDEVIVSL